jgi:hypothetical protein
MKDPALLSGVTDNWQTKSIRFKRGEHGDLKYFSYARGKTKEEAISEANAYAEEYTKLYGPPRPVSYKGIMTSRNRSGKPGVFIYKKHFKKWNRDYWYWAAEWPGRRYSKRFSYIEYGDEKAYLLACIACELETLDTEFVLAEFPEFEKKGIFETWLKQKKQSIVA